MTANLAPVSHLRPVPDPQPPSRKGAGEPARPSVAELERWATLLRIDCVRMLAVAKSGHLDSSLSAADIVAALYYRVLRHDPAAPEWPDRDRFVLCKGHAAPIQYAALAHLGYFPLEDLMGLRQIGAQLQGHPDMNRTSGVEVSTGSLGQGLSMCLGICLALRLDGLAETAQVFGVLSDGDCQEGQTWEAATAAAHFGITNLTAVVDYNHLQTDGTTEEVMDTGDVRAKFEAFGWDAVEIHGHDMAAVVEALERSRALDRPAAIVCQTTKGKGVSAMEGRFGFHGKPPSPELAAEALAELEARLERQTGSLGAGAREAGADPADALETGADDPDSDPPE
ncbi:MAG: transketolase [Solirubrobacterales bacterium]|nr:transketolase [Solirubrobacterales bacterium]